MSNITIQPEEIKSKYCLRQSYAGIAFVDTCENTDITQCKKDFSDLIQFCVSLNNNLKTVDKK